MKAERTHTITDEQRNHLYDAAAKVQLCLHECYVAGDSCVQFNGVFQLTPGDIDKMLIQPLRTAMDHFYCAGIPGPMLPQDCETPP